MQSPFVLSFIHSLWQREGRSELKVWCGAGFVRCMAVKSSRLLSLSSACFMLSSLSTISSGIWKTSSPSWSVTVFVVSIWYLYSPDMYSRATLKKAHCVTYSIATEAMHVTPQWSYLCKHCWAQFAITLSCRTTSLQTPHTTPNHGKEFTVGFSHIPITRCMGGHAVPLQRTMSCLQRPTALGLIVSRRTRGIQLITSWLWNACPFCACV